MSTFQTQLLNTATVVSLRRERALVAAHVACELELSTASAICRVGDGLIVVRSSPAHGTLAVVTRASAKVDVECLHRAITAATQCDSVSTAIRVARGIYGAELPGVDMIILNGRAGGLFSTNDTPHAEAQLREGVFAPGNWSSDELVTLRRFDSEPWSHETDILSTFARLRHARGFSESLIDATDAERRGSFVTARLVRGAWSLRVDSQPPGEPAAIAIRHPIPSDPARSIASKE